MSRKRYQCIRPCFFKARLWQIGEVAVFEDGEWPKDKNGKIRHFEPIGKPEPPASIEATAAPDYEEEKEEPRRGPGRPKKETE